MRDILQVATFCAVWLACDAEKPSPPSSSALAAAGAPASPSPTPQPQPRPAGSRWAKEFGIGVVRYAAMSRYEAEDVIRASPSLGADTVAVLNRESLCFSPGNCVRSYDRMIEFDYEIPGWAILRLSGDSAWAEVSLAAVESTSPTGWVSLRGDSVLALLWSRILPDKRLFFMRPSDIAFYRAPVDTAKAQRSLSRHPNSDRFDYTMRPLEAEGRWLRVELLTPSPMCKGPAPTVTPDTLWIQYLTEEGRPRVFYHTRGC